MSNRGKDVPTDPKTGEALETHTPSAEEKAAQKQRNRMMAVALLAFIVLVFTITVFRLSSNISAGG